MALIQDIVFDAGKLKLTMRYAIFETDDYDNRQYSYENDVWLAYSMPAYSGVGVRKMAIVEYKISRNLSVWLRYSHIRYENLQFIGDGLDRIDRDQKDDVKAQVVVKFWGRLLVRLIGLYLCQTKLRGKIVFLVYAAIKDHGSQPCTHSIK